jgi:hypothetical protein
MFAVLPLAFAFICLFGSLSTAAELARPSGPVVLTVVGHIERKNDGERAVFDRAMLHGIGLVKVRTTTPWTDGVMEFEGVPVKALLQAVGSRGQVLRATAINDYTIDLDAREFDAVPAILALRMNGTDLRVRDKGPLWLVYPRDDYPAVRSEMHNFKWIWQLKTITVR